ncbi:polysaccharide deacetylase family protein [Proteiniclasticum sp.]|uniref:polysaccharide deacetylase family protein n=1 Tax=Proteiniclasticum sp. TaxID=2053595 RepID=UPI00289DF5C6|nr:polysaccharide deacetylase family protein [Proteiniclasticum sp.]
MPAGDKDIAFTFDDGPDPRYTPQLLDLLKQHRIKATFFVLGEKAKANPDIIRRIVDEGHVIGLHANKHIGAPFRSYKAMKDDFHNSLDILKNMGVRIHLYRPPWGLVNVVSRKFIREYKFAPILWSIHASDWSRYCNEEHIEKVLTQKVKPGDIVLLHDGRGAKEAPQRTINALKSAIPQMKKKGFRFVIPMDSEKTTTA